VLLRTRVKNGEVKSLAATLKGTVEDGSILRRRPNHTLKTKFR